MYVKATESAGKTRNRLSLTPRLQWIVLEETRTFMALLSVDYVVDLSCTENILEGFWNGIYTGPKSAPRASSNQHRSKQDNKTQVTVWQKTRGLLLDYKVKVTGISGTGKPVPVR